MTPTLEGIHDHITEEEDPLVKSQRYVTALIYDHVYTLGFLIVTMVFHNLALTKYSDSHVSHRKCPPLSITQRCVWKNFNGHFFFWIWFLLQTLLWISSQVIAFTDKESCVRWCSMVFYNLVLTKYSDSHVSHSKGSSLSVAQRCVWKNFNRHFFLLDVISIANAAANIITSDSFYLQRTLCGMMYEYVCEPLKHSSWLWTIPLALIHPRKQSAKISIPQRSLFQCSYNPLSVTILSKR